MRSRGNPSHWAFTILELLVVVSIISVLITVGTFSYVTVQRKARDARRRADLEEIRAAFEQWRSDNGAYPTSQAVNCSVAGGLVSGANTYLQTIPKDPQCPARNYYAQIASADYTLAAALEFGGTACTGNPACGTGIICNYCVGPYGVKP